MSEISKLNGYDLKDKIAREDISNIHSSIDNINDSIANTFVDTVNDMKSLTTLNDGDVVKTLGYYSKNDGGDGLYRIREKTLSDVEDNGTIHFIDDLVAELIYSDTINVKVLGAKGDNTADDTDVFTNAINKFNNIFIPDGTYIISSTLTLKSNIYIYGSPNVTIKQKNASNINNIFYGNQLSNIKLKDIQIDLNVENQSYSDRANSGRGMLLTSCNLINIQNVNTNKIYGSFIYIVDSTNVKIEKCKINDPDGAYSGFGIYLVRSQHCLVDKCEFVGVRVYGTSLSTYGVQAKDSCLDIVVQNCYFNKMQCIIDGSKTNGTATTSTSCKIINNFLVDTGGDTTMRYCKYGLIANNIVRGSGDFGISVGDSEFVNVCNNIVDGSNTVGIGIRASSQCTVNNNSISNPCVNFRNLDLVANQRDGIYVLGNSRRTNVCNNTIIDTQTGTAKMYSGIRIEDISGGVAGADDSFAVICNNTIYGASQLASQIVSASTKNVVDNNLLQS